MDLVSTLSFFDKWHARHKSTCGVTDLDVSSDRSEGNGTKFRLACPSCGQSISGSILDSDMPHVVKLLAPGQAN